LRDPGLGVPADGGGGHPSPPPRAPHQHHGRPAISPVRTSRSVSVFLYLRNCCVPDQTLFFTDLDSQIDYQEFQIGPRILPIFFNIFYVD